MPDFAITNLKEVDDVAAARGPGIEARFARQQLDSEHLGVSYFRYGPNYRSPIGHRHREQEEAYVVVSGSGRVRLDDEIVELSEWDVIRVAPSVVRSRAGLPRPATDAATKMSAPATGTAPRSGVTGRPKVV